MNRNWLKSCAALALAAIFFVGCSSSGGGGSGRSSAAPAAIHTDGRWFKDDQGRVVILRGFNVGGTVKWDPWQYWYTEKEWETLKDWGMDVVRMLIIWEPIEQQKGVYSDWFFKTRTDQQVAWAEEQGINVVLDMHQDLYGPAVSGDGAPAWATRTDIPFTVNVPWGVNYLAQAVVKSYDQFWSSTELQDHYIGAWLMAVNRYKGRKIIIGYDLYNEPHCGTMAPWQFSREVLGPFQDRVAQAIRRLDPGRIIFYEPLIYTSSGMPVFLPPPRARGAALAPHFYDPTLGLVHSEPYDHDTSRMKNMMDLRDKEVKWLGNIPWLLGEFGVDQSATGYHDYLVDIYNQLDAHMASGTLWEYGKGGMGPFNPDGSEKPEFVDAIVRPYPQRIAGEPVSFGYDPAANVFTLTYDTVAGVTGPTEIFIPEALKYPGGFNVITSDKNVTTEWDGRILKVYHDPDAATHTVRVEPAS